MSEYPELLRQAVSLARRLQDPLVEFAQLCNSENDILALHYHPMQVIHRALICPSPPILLLSFLFYCCCYPFVSHSWYASLYPHGSVPLLLNSLISLVILLLHLLIHPTPLLSQM